MIDATEIGFAVREVGRGVFFTARYQHGEPLPDMNIDDASDAALSFQGQVVLVTGLRQIDSDQFTAEITGFEPAVSETFDGITVGDVIAFRERHIFSASVDA